MRKFIIERIIPAIGQAEGAELSAVAQRSNSALRDLGPDIQWIESYVADNKTFCVYLASDESLIRRHADLSGFPADIITEIETVFDPSLASEEEG